jgi:hypothetical protein
MLLIYSVLARTLKCIVKAVCEENKKRLKNTLSQCSCHQAGLTLEQRAYSLPAIPTLFLFKLKLSYCLSTMAFRCQDVNMSTHS